MMVEHKQIGWKFWLMWGLVALVSTVLGFAIMFVGLGEVLDSVPSWVFGIALGVLFGTLRAIGHWLLLRRQIKDVVLWIPLTVAAWVIFWPLNLVGVFGEAAEGDIGGKILEGLLHGAIFGLLLGVAQWLVLRAKVERAYWWILVLVVSWAVSAATADGLRAALGPEATGIDLLIGLLLADWLNGIGIVWLLHQRVPEPVTPTQS